MEFVANTGIHGNICNGNGRPGFTECMSVSSTDSLPSAGDNGDTPIQPEAFQYRFGG
jgi:hypothetical protein